jgi:hypothetical protein
LQKVAQTDRRSLVRSPKTASIWTKEIGTRNTAFPERTSSPCVVETATPVQEDAPLRARDRYDYVPR